MHKKVLVCLPLNDAHRAALEASVPEFEFRFNALDDVQIGRASCRERV